MPKVCILSSVHIALDNRVFYREARSLKKAGYDVTLIAVHDREEVKDGIRIIPLPRVPRWQRPRLWLRLFSLARATKADIYHFHDPELLLVTPFLQLITGKPTIYDVHEVYSDTIKYKRYFPKYLRYTFSWVFRWLEPLLARMQSGLVFVVKANERTFRHVNLPKVTLYNFPSLEFVQTALTATKGTGQIRPTVLYLGTISEDRGVILALDAFELVTRVYVDTNLFLVGKCVPPEFEQVLHKMIDAKGLQNRVVITGPVAFEQIGHYLLRAYMGWITLQAVPNYQKGIPTKLFEYMAYALPVVSSDLPPVRQFVSDGENGLLVNPADPAAHAAAIIRLFENPQLASDIGRRGQKLVTTRYNWTLMESRLLQLYNTLLSGKSS